VVQGAIYLKSERNNQGGGLEAGSKKVERGAREGGNSSADQLKKGKKSTRTGGDDASGIEHQRVQ